MCVYSRHRRNPVAILQALPLNHRRSYSLESILLMVCISFIASLEASSPSPLLVMLVCGGERLCLLEDSPVENRSIPRRQPAAAVAVVNLHIDWPCCGCRSISGGSRVDRTRCSQPAAGDTAAAAFAVATTAATEDCLTPASFMRVTPTRPPLRESS